MAILSLGDCSRVANIRGASVNSSVLENHIFGRGKFDAFFFCVCVLCVFLRVIWDSGWIRDNWN